MVARVFVVILALAVVIFGTMALLLTLPEEPQETPDFQQAQGPSKEPIQTTPVDSNPGPLWGENHVLSALPPDYSIKRQRYAALYAKGDYEGAIGAIEAMLRELPKDEGLKADLASALFGAGLQALQRSDLTRASELLSRSVGLGNRAARGALARALLLNGQKSEAKRILEEAFRQRPERGVLEALVDLSLSEGNSAAALSWLDEYDKMYQQASLKQEGHSLPGQAAADGVVVQKSDAEAEQQGMKAFLNSRRRRAASGNRFDAAGFSIDKDEVGVRYLDPRAERLAEGILARVHSAVDSMRSRFGAISGNARFDLELFEEESFGDATGAPPWAGAIFDGIMRIPYPPRALGGGSATIHIERMAVHEVTHAYLNALCGDSIPSWMGEGLAQVAEGRNPQAALSSLSQAFGQQWRRLAPVADLDRPFIRFSDANHVRNLYLASLALTGALEKRHGAGVWRRIISASCTGGVSLPEALEGELGGRSAEALWLRVFGDAKP